MKALLSLEVTLAFFTICVEEQSFFGKVLGKKLFWFSLHEFLILLNLNMIILSCKLNQNKW